MFPVWLALLIVTSLVALFVFIARKLSRGRGLSQAQAIRGSDMSAHQHAAVEEFMDAVVRDLDKQALIAPEYRSDLTCQEDFQKTDRLALVTVWGEHIVGTDIRYSVVINSDIIADRMSADIPRDAKGFDAIKQTIAKRIEVLADDRLRAEVLRSGRKPSQVCQTMPDLKSSSNGNASAITAEDHCKAFVRWAVDSGLAMPRYRSDIKTLVDIETAEDLPLVYVWSPEKAGGNVSISINGHVVAQYLLAQLPRGSVEYDEARDLIFDAVQHMSQGFFDSACSKTGMSVKEVALALG